MKIALEYGFNNESLSKFEEYEIKIINDIKYVVPKVDKENKTTYSLINFEDYEENDKPLIDFINLGKLSLEDKEDTDSLLLEYINQYGLLGLIHNLPVNRYYTLDKKVLLLDDIITTGSTANECARMLLTSNPKKIGVLTIAKD